MILWNGDKTRCISESSESPDGMELFLCIDKETSCAFYSDFGFKTRIEMLEYLNENFSAEKLYYFKRKEDK